jgi:hypothetical protein
MNIIYGKLKKMEHSLQSISNVLFSEETTHEPSLMNLLARVTSAQFCFLFLPFKGFAPNKHLHSHTISYLLVENPTYDSQSTWKTVVSF